MPNMAALLKQEIARLSKREIRREIAGIKKASNIARRDIAALKRQVAQLERLSAQLSKNAAKSKQSVPISPDKPVRFVAKGLVALRKRLGFSAAALGSILGVSEQAVYNWETKKSVPRKDSLDNIIALRGIGKREAQQRLADKASAPANERAQPVTRTKAPVRKRK